MGDMKIDRILVGRPEERGPLWGPRYREEDNIKMDQGYGLECGLDYCGIGCGPVTCTCEYYTEPVPWGGYSLTSRVTLVLRRNRFHYEMTYVTQA
jgi:hypothetical protein